MAALLAVGREQPDALAVWTPNVVAGFVSALDRDVVTTVTVLLAAVLDIASPADPVTDAARAHAVRSLRELDEITTENDPLVAVVTTWLDQITDPATAAAFRAIVLQRVDDLDRQRLTELFIEG